MKALVSKRGRLGGNQTDKGGRRRRQIDYRGEGVKAQLERKRERARTGEKQRQRVREHMSGQWSSCKSGAKGTRMSEHEQWHMQRPPSARERARPRKSEDGRG
eukprot:5994078-Pleurochrysis_carterae.AAC.1